MPELHLWRLAIDPARWAAIASEQHIPSSDEDHGYLGHALLCGLFGKDHAPKPWFLDHRRMLLLAYAGHPLAEATTADPLYHAAVYWDRSASRPMPHLRVGQRVRFDVRVCPVVRNGKRKGQGQRSTEHDWLLWQARMAGVGPEKLDASVVYAEWLRERAWKTDCGAHLNDVQVAGWVKPMTGGANAWRGRGDGRLRLPDVRFSGEATVTDPEAFQASLAHGIGRHRAFGFGMLLMHASIG